MQVRIRIAVRETQGQRIPRRCRYLGAFGLTFLILPLAAYAQSGSPFDTGFTAIQTLFTGTVAKVASLIAIVVGGYRLRMVNRGPKTWPVSLPAQGSPCLPRTF